MPVWYQLNEELILINVGVEINDLLAQAKLIDIARPEKAVLLEKAVQLADSHNEIELGFTARQELVRVCTFSGHPDKAIIAFSWCLGQNDKNPGRFDQWLLVWEYKWVVLALIKFPQIPLEKIAEFMEDAGRRLEEYEGGRRALYQLRAWQYQNMGLMDEEQRAYEEWQSSPRGVWGFRKGMSNCRACEISDDVYHHILWSRDREAIDAAKPLLAQQVTCESSGKSIFGMVLVPLVRLGELDKAQIYHRTGYRLISTNLTFLDSVAGHINYLTIVNDLDKAVKLFGKHLIWALEAAALTDVFEFYLASRLLFTRLIESRQMIKLRLPKAFPLYKRDGEYDVEALTSWFDEQLHSIATKFDARNKTDYFKGRIDQSQLQALFLPSNEIS